MSERLRFRALRPEDGPAVADVFADPYARRFFPHITLEVAELWILDNVERYRVHGFGLWALELESTGEFVGDCGLTIQDVDGAPELEVGYHIHARFRRRGLATEAAQASLAYGFAATTAPRIVSLVHKRNAASLTVAERIHRERSETIRSGAPHWVYFTRREDGEPLE